MKELDFDELDRAVNSLMANVPKTAPQTDDTKEKTLSIDSTLDSGTPPPFSKVEETAAKAVDEPAASPVPTPASESASKAPEPAAHAMTMHARPQAPAATSASRKGGRFMDVVHPSADMTKPDNPRPVSRQGATIEPLSSSSQKIADIVPQKKPKAVDEKPVEAPKAEDEPAASEPASEPSVPAVALPIAPTPAPEPPKTDEPSSMSDWPDPLDMMTPKTDEEEIKEEPKDEPETPVEPKADEIPAPLTSPFLPDTKVEKRPLGGVPTEAEPPLEEPSRPPVIAEEETPKTVDDPNDQLPANPNEVETQLPEELRGDLMAVEADTTHDELKQAHESKATVKPAAVTSKPAVRDEPESSAAEEPAPAGPTSIPQQYREEPSTGDKDSGAIYDTDTYHQPLAHPAKKKSGWMWVVWIVLILLVGAGGGALLFLLKIV